MNIKDEGTVFSDEEQDILFQLEANSWWFQYRARVITGVMKRYFDPQLKTVDVGGGNGYTTSIAQQMGFSVALLEPSVRACENATKRGIDAHAGLMTDEYPNDNDFVQVLLLDVLEHIEDDMCFLRLLHRKIRENGTALITVPAYMHLWSSEDDYAGHYRRYTERELRNKAEEAGFKVLYSGYFMRFLYLPILFVRVGLEKIGIIKRQDERTEEERDIILEKQFETKENGLVDFVLKILEMNEYRKIRKGYRVAAGSSVIIVLQR